MLLPRGLPRASLLHTVLCGLEVVSGFAGSEVLGVGSARNDLVLSRGLPRASLLHTVLCGLEGVSGFAGVELLGSGSARNDLSNSSE